MIENKILSVSGMKCGGCEANVVGKLSPIAGVLSVVADHKANQVTVQFDDQITDLNNLIKVVTDAGFTVG